MVLLVRIIVYAISALLLADVIISFIPGARWKPFGRIVERLCYPLLLPFRKMARPVRFGSHGAVDVSPALCILSIDLVALLIIWLLKSQGIH